MSSFIFFNCPFSLLSGLPFSNSWCATWLGVTAAILDWGPFFRVKPFDGCPGFLTVLGHIDVGYDFLPALFSFVADGSKQVLSEFYGVFGERVFIVCLDILFVLVFGGLGEAGDVVFPTASGDVSP